MNNEENIHQKNIENTKKRNKRIIGLRIGIFSLLAIICIIVGVIVMRKQYKDLNKVEFDNYELYQYFAGVKIEYNGKVTIQKENEITSIKNKDEEMDLDIIPIYFQKIDNQVMFPVSVSVVYLNNKTQTYRLNYFTKLESEVVNDEESTFVYYKDKKLFLSDSIIYDGDNLYLFPYSTTVVVNEEKFELSPLSYVIVDYKDSIEIYDKKNDKYTIIDDVQDDVIAYCKKFKIDLSTDMIMYENGNRILRKNINKIELFGTDK